MVDDMIFHKYIVAVGCSIIMQLYATRSTQFAGQGNGSLSLRNLGSKQLPQSLTED